MNRTIFVALFALMFAGPAVAQDFATSPELVRAILDDLRDWPPDSKAVPKKTARKWAKARGARERYAKLFEEGGAVQSIEFIDAFDSGDAYLIEFENARVLVLYTQEPKRRWNWRAAIKVPR